jgi:hypothetical protein
MQRASRQLLLGLLNSRRLAGPICAACKTFFYLRANSPLCDRLLAAGDF